jgi:uncharacterized membrane protein
LEDEYACNKVDLENNNNKITFNGNNNAFFTQVIYENLDYNILTSNDKVSNYEKLNSIGS